MTHNEARLHDAHEAQRRYVRPPAGGLVAGELAQRLGGLVGCRLHEGRQNTSKPAEQSKHVKTRRAVRTRQTVPQLRASSAREGNAGGPGLGVCREALGVKLVLVPAQPGARVVKGGQRWSNGEVTRGRRERCFRAGHAVDEAARIHAVASAPPSHSPPKRQRNSQRLGKAESGGTSRSLRPRSRACTPRRGRRVPRGRCAGSTPQRSGVDSIRGAEVSSITGGGPK